MKEEHKTPDFTSLNPRQKVPVLEDGAAVVTESCAIMTYVARKFGCLSVYPDEALERARVDEWLHWHHLGLRRHTAGLFSALVNAPARGESVSGEAVEAATHGSVAALRDIEAALTGTGFLTGSTEPTVADFIVHCEVAQLDAVDWDWAGTPGIARWRRDAEALPGYTESHREWLKFLPRIQSAVRARRRSAGGPL